MKLWKNKKKGFLFFFLCFLEIFYRAGFFLVILIKKKIGFKKIFRYKIISVGNLTVGGTGKSPFAKFLSENIQGFKGAILMRGYARKREYRKKSLVLHRDSVDFSVNFSVTEKFGDEAVMLAQSLPMPIVVGKDRAASLSVLHNFCKKSESKIGKIDYVILDDAYQNFRLRKDFEVLLLDAREPFGNGRCLPAGPLREKDFSRANVIVLTHADEVSLLNLSSLKSIISKKIYQENIFSGRHSPLGLFIENKIDVLPDKNKKFLAVAGIGSFSGFIYSLKSCDILVAGEIEYRDHFNYSNNDVLHILHNLKKNDCCGIVTTEKDWVKLSRLRLVKENKSLFFVLRICFEFLSTEENDRFLKLLRNSIINLKI